MEKIKTFIIISFIVAILGGCIAPNMQPVAVHEKKVSDISDIVTISNVRMIPSSPILPDTTVTFSFDVKNMHENEIAKCIHARLYSYYPFKIVKNNNIPGESCYESGFVPKNEIEVVNRGDLYPGEKTVVSYTLRSPSSDEIGNLTTNLELKYRMTYNFVGNTIFQFVIVNQTQINDMEQAGKSLNLETMNKMGPGPIKIRMKLLNGGNMIIGGTTGIVEFKIENTGSGTISNYYNVIGKNKLTIGIPKGLGPKFNGIKFEKSECPKNFIKGLECYSNSDKITLYQGSSPPYKIILTSTDVNQIQKTYAIESSIDYQYMLSGTYNVEVNPHE